MPPDRSQDVRSQSEQIRGVSDYRTERFQGRQIARLKSEFVDTADITTVSREAVTSLTAGQITGQTDHKAANQRPDRLQDQLFRADRLEGWNIS